MNIHGMAFLSSQGFKQQLGVLVLGLTYLLCCHRAAVWRGVKQGTSEALRIVTMVRCHECLLHRGRRLIAER